MGLTKHAPLEVE